MEKMVFVGYQYGTFTAQDGVIQNFCNVFFLQDFRGESNSSYHFAGQKAVKYKASSPDIFASFKPGDHVIVAFDSYGRVSYMVADQAK